MEESKLTDMEGDVECNIDTEDKLDMGMDFLYGSDEGDVRDFGPHVDQELGQIDGANEGSVWKSVRYGISKDWIQRIRDFLE
ncbi:hypothetical protein Tco_0750788 [Tanacetum coccineum]|uniref:Uncharacterized protein n=1 Tax=Tanacetum coccineum TaxID=301880 RepID=A0ABQ4Z4Z2_9ASTR